MLHSIQKMLRSVHQIKGRVVLKDKEKLAPFKKCLVVLVQKEKINRVPDSIFLYDISISKVENHTVFWKYSCNYFFVNYQFLFESDMQKF